MKKIQQEIINIIGKLDNGSHSSSQLQGTDEALYDVFEREIDKYKEALIWCSGSDDFQVGGKARIGWEKVKNDLLT